MTRKKAIVGNKPKIKNKLPFLGNLSIYIIGSYYIFEGFGILINSLLYASHLSKTIYTILNRSSFFYTDLPNFLSKDPFVDAIIQTIRIYNDFFIYCKDIFMFVVFLSAGWMILQRKKIGLYLGLFISIFGLVFGTTYGLRYSSLEYIENIYGGISHIWLNGYVEFHWIMSGISFLIALITPFYLIKNYKLFSE